MAWKVSKKVNGEESAGVWIRGLFYKAGSTLPADVEPERWQVDRGHVVKATSSSGSKKG